MVRVLVVVAEDAKGGRMLVPECRFLHRRRGGLRLGLRGGSGGLVGWRM